jgi:hypothetical protein
VYTYVYSDVKITFTAGKITNIQQAWGGDRVTESLYQRCAHRDSQCFLAARNARAFEAAACSEAGPAVRRSAVCRPE